jgi:hypothetical protein
MTKAEPLLAHHRRPAGTLEGQDVEATFQGSKAGDVQHLLLAAVEPLNISYTTNAGCRFISCAGDLRLPRGWNLGEVRNPASSEHTNEYQRHDDLYEYHRDNHQRMASQVVLGSRNSG